MNQLVKLDHKTMVSLKDIVVLEAAAFGFTNRRTFLSMKSGPTRMMIEGAYREVLQICAANGMNHLCPVTDSISVDKDRIVSIVDFGDYCQLTFTNGAKFDVQADLNAVIMSLDGASNAKSLIIGAPSSSVLSSQKNDP